MNQLMTHLEKTGASLVIRQIFPATPERLFAAWTNPEQMNAWFHPGGQMKSITAVNLTVGGHYRIEMRSEKSGPYVVQGVYREIIPNKKLVFTWRWVAEDAEPETLVTVDFIPVGAAETEIVLTHDHFIQAEERDNHGEGWQGTFVQLAAHLT